MADRSETSEAPDATHRPECTEPSGGPGSTAPFDSTATSDSTENSDSSDVPDHGRGYPASAPHRRRAALATLPFLLLGLAVVAFGVVASPRPLFGFLIFPPVVFVSVLTYVAFRSRFEADAG